MKKIISLILAFSLIFGCVSILSSCGGGNDDGGNTDDKGFGDAKVIYVEMDFGSYGKTVIEVDRVSAPKTADNFLSLVKRGFYDDLTIFRAQKDFVIQGGKNSAENVGTVQGEFAANGYANPISHTKGVISMARTGDPNSATSQFFITLSDGASSSLDGGYASFGRVVSGMDAVEAIAEALIPKAADSMGFVNDADAIKILSAKIIEFSTVDNSRTEIMGTGACEYLDTRDISGRDIKYVEMCIRGYGKLVILLDATTAPVTVANFISLVESGFYNGLTFHRIIKNFMIQGGDPEANGTGGSDHDIFGEFASNGHENDISHLYGVISMARSQEPNSASSQFFICNADASSSLDGNYAAFGYVVEGMSVVDAITAEVFPTTDFAAYHNNVSYDSYYGGYKYMVWQYYGNGAIANSARQPVIEYIKVLDSWTK